MMLPCECVSLITLRRETLFVMTGPKFHPDSFVRHDQMGFISTEHAFAASMNLPVPVGMFMPPMMQPYPGMPPMQGQNTPPPPHTQCRI